MSMRISARSISQPVWERLWKGPFAARVLAVFKHVCSLVTPDGCVVALVLPQVGDGPLNVVVHGRPGDFAAVEPGMSAWLEGRRLRVGGLEIVLEGAVVWEPRPDWDRLRPGRGGITARLPFLWPFALRNAPAGSLLPLAWEWAGGPDHSVEAVEAVEAGCVSEALAPVARDAAEALRAGWGGGAGQLREGAAQLAGLGSGLTPAGDDFLTGAMLWAWLAHSDPRIFCRTLVTAAAPRTTTLSAAFLQAAARGECSAAWHTLLAALSHGSDVEVTRGVQGVLAHGATSGADALAGFLWAGTHSAA